MAAQMSRPRLPDKPDDSGRLEREAAHYDSLAARFAGRSDWNGRRLAIAYTLYAASRRQQAAAARDGRPGEWRDYPAHRASDRSLALARDIDVCESLLAELAAWPAGPERAGLRALVAGALEHKRWLRRRANGVGPQNR